MKKVYVIGDSISIHYGPYLERYLKGFMRYTRKEGVEQSLQNLDTPMGANGGDSSNVLAFLEYKIQSGGIDADALLVNCGLHDIKTDPGTGRKQVPLEDYRKNLLEIVTLVKKSGVRLIWIRTTPCEERIHNVRNSQFRRFAKDSDEYNRAADEIMREAGIPEIDLYGFTRNLGGDEIFCDHVHFTEDVRQKQAAFIAGWLAGNMKKG